MRTVRSARPESDGKRDGAAWARKLGSFKRARIGRRGRRARARRRTLAEELRGAEAVDVVHGDAGIRLGAFVRHGERSARGTARRWKWRAPQLRSWKKAHGAQQLVSNKVRVLANFALFAWNDSLESLEKMFSDCLPHELDSFLDAPRCSAFAKTLIVFPVHRDGRRALLLLRDPPIRARWRSARTSACPRARREERRSNKTSSSRRSGMTSRRPPCSP